MAGPARPPAPYRARAPLGGNLGPPTRTLSLRCRRLPFGNFAPVQIPASKLQYSPSCSCFAWLLPQSGWWTMGRGMLRPGHRGAHGSTGTLYFRVRNKGQKEALLRKITNPTPLHLCCSLGRPFRNSSLCPPPRVATRLRAPNPGGVQGTRQVMD